MRSRIAQFVLVFLALGLVAGAGLPAFAAPSGAGLKIDFITAQVSPGGTLSVKTSAPRGSECRLIIGHGRVAAANLLTRPLPSGHTTWNYRLPRSAPNGSWFVLFVCGRYDKVRAQFRVGAPPIPAAQVSVLKSGFSAETFGGGTDLSCGVVLQNSSPVSDARDLSVKVEFDDTLGRSLVSTTVSVTAIPAGQTFYAACYANSNISISVSTIKVQVMVGRSTKKGAVLPSVSALTVGPNTYDTAIQVKGTFTNPYAVALPQDAVTNAVYFDGGGNVVGGDISINGASVQPGATVGFSFDYAPAATVSAQVSVDPCGFSSRLSCKLP